MKKNYSLLGRGAIFMAALIWGTSFVVLKGTLESVGTMWVLAIRFSVATLLMLAFSFKSLKSVSPRCIKGSAIMGVFLAVAYIVQTYGLVYTTPGKNAFLTATYCVLTPFLAWIIYKRRAAVSNFIAAFLCIIGIGFVSLNGGFGTVGKGDVLTLLCGIFYAFQIIALEHYGDSGDARVIAGLQFAAAAVICLLGAIIFEPLPTNVSIGTWISIAYLSVMCTAVCFFLQAWGMKYTSSSVAAMLMTLEAVFGVLISVLFFGERLTMKLVIGFVLIFVAELITELSPEKRKSSAV